MNHTLDEMKVILNDTAKSLAFDLTKQEEDDLFAMFASIQDTLLKIHTFEVGDVQPSSFPDNDRFYTNMRDDVEMDLNLHTLDIFANTKEFRNQMVVLNNVKK